MSWQKYTFLRSKILNIGDYLLLPFLFDLWRSICQNNHIIQISYPLISIFFELGSFIYLIILVVFGIVQVFKQWCDVILDFRVGAFCRVEMQANLAIFENILLAFSHSRNALKLIFKSLN